MTHLHVSADNLQLLLNVHDLLFRNLDTMFERVHHPCFSLLRVLVWSKDMVYVLLF